MTQINRSQQTFLSRIAPGIMLFFLAPLFGEYLLGNLKISEIVLLLFIAPLYGAGALLIREVARRAGRGYATILMLGLAYSLIEEGLVDQLIFNALYFDGQEQLMNTVIPALGIDLWLTLIIMAMHAIWSICIPIMIVEAIFAKRGTEPWLGNIGLTVVAVIFILGSAWLAHEIYLENNFLASASQMIGTTILIIVIIAAAFMIKIPREAPAEGFVPNPWIAGSLAFAASSIYMLTESLPGWTKVGVCLLVALVFFVFVSQWSGRRGWTPLHRLALAGGGILTYSWLGALMEPETGPKTAMDHVGTIILIGCAIWLLSIGVKKIRELETVSV